MGRLKSEYQNSLDVETVDMLMNICLNGPSPNDFTAERAVLQEPNFSKNAKALLKGSMT